MSCGVLALSGGLISVSFAHKTWQLYLSQGVSVGVGIGFVYVPSITVLSQWFSKKRSLANGITAAGPGVGGVIFSLVTGKIIEKISVEWSLRITGLTAFRMNCLAVALDNPRPERLHSAGTATFDIEFLTRYEVWLFIWTFVSVLGYITLLYSLPDFTLSSGLSQT